MLYGVLCFVVCCASMYRLLFLHGCLLCCVLCVVCCVVCCVLRVVLCVSVYIRFSGNQTLFLHGLFVEMAYEIYDLLRVRRKKKLENQ